MSKKNFNEIVEFKEEVREIVKRIPHPEPEQEPKEEVSFYHEYKNTISPPKKKKTKKILPVLLGVTALGLIGYLGLSYLQQEDEPKKQESTYSADKSENVKKLINSSHTESTTELAVVQEALMGMEDKENQYIENLSNERTEVGNVGVQKTFSDMEYTQKQEVNSVEKALREMEEKTKEIDLIQKALMEIDHEEKKEIKVESNEAVVYNIPTQYSRSTKVESVIPQRKSKKIHYENIEPRTVIIRRGDTLASLAQRFYGDRMDFKRIVRANYRIKSSKTPLHLGEKMVIPRKDGKKRRRFVIIERGDNLASISKYIYGTTDRIPTIVQANYRIKSKNSLLQLGQKVYVPRLEFYK